MEYKEQAALKGGGSMGMEFTDLYNVLMTVAIGIITWCLKELYARNEKRQLENKTAIEALEEKTNKNQRELYREFVTKEDHYRDINTLEQKIDNIKDILMEMKNDIGELVGRTGKEGS